MKKLLALLLALLLISGLCSCTLEKTVSFLDDVNEILEELPDAEEPIDVPEEEVLSEDEEKEKEEAPPEKPALSVTEDGEYSSKDEVALYIHLFGHLPSNYITKKQAEKSGWKGGALKDGKCIGGTYFGNYEGLLPEAEDRYYTECDVDTAGKKDRGEKRIVFSNDGLIYYTDDHYKTFTLLYGEENE